jgi:RND family efflux transporter MFP subunit
MHRHKGSVFALIIVAALGGCAADKEQQAAAPPPPEVMVSQVVSRDVIEYGKFTGRTVAVDSVDIRARVTGYLTEIAFTDGQEVKPGNLLFQIDPRPFKAALDNAEGQKAQWVAKLARAKSDVERYKKLVPTGAATQQDLDKAEADMGEATAAIQSAEATIENARLNLEFSRITAPLGGQISKAAFSKGNLVRGDNDLLTTIVAIDPMYVNFSVNERDLLLFRERARASIPPSGTQPDVRTLKIPVYLGLINEEGYPHPGVINFSDNRVDPNTGTILLRGTFDNSKRIFKPGLFARVRVPVNEVPKAILVTDRAIGTDQSQKFVCVVDDKNIVQYRPVKLGGLEDDGLRVVTEGLQPGESVIVTGMQRARPGKPVNPQRVEMPRAGMKAVSQPAASAPGNAVAQATPTARQ